MIDPLSVTSPETPCATLTADASEKYLEVAAFSRTFGLFPAGVSAFFVPVEGWALPPLEPVGAVFPCSMAS